MGHRNVRITLYALRDSPKTLKFLEDVLLLESAPASTPAAEAVELDALAPASAVEFDEHCAALPFLLPCFFACCAA